MNLYYSLRIISKIDSIVNDNSIENNVFSPMPLGNSCCIDKVGEDYKYLNYFSEDKSIDKLLEQSVNLDNSLYDITNVCILEKKKQI